METSSPAGGTRAGFTPGGENGTLSHSGTGSGHRARAPETPGSGGPQAPSQAETHSARVSPGLDPVAPKDLAFSKISEESPRPQAPRRGSTPGKGGGKPAALWRGGREQGGIGGGCRRER